MIKAAYEAGLSDFLYNLFGYVNAAAVLIYVVLFSGKYKLNVVKTITSMVILYAGGGTA